jgi:hypothetical protein
MYTVYMVLADCARTSSVGMTYEQAWYVHARVESTMLTQTHSHPCTYTAFLASGFHKEWCVRTTSLSLRISESKPYPQGLASLDGNVHSTRRAQQTYRDQIQCQYLTMSLWMAALSTVHSKQTVSEPVPHL